MLQLRPSIDGLGEDKLTNNKTYNITNLKTRKNVLTLLYIENSFLHDRLVYNYCCNIERNNRFLLKY